MGYPPLFLPSMPQCALLLLAARTSRPTPCQARSFLSGPFPLLTPPCGCTKKVDISPELDVCEKNVLDECQARPQEMSQRLSKETCQEFGQVKIATVWCGCGE